MNKFKCPDGQTITCDDCLEKCRMGNRCVSLPILQVGSRTRDYKNRKAYSVTEVLSPTLLMYLKAKYGEVIDPFSVIPSLIGTSIHAILEGNLPVDYAGEFRISKDGITGQMDCIDLKGKTLYDYKVVGGYKAMRMMGYEQKRVPRIITRGKRKGEEEWTPVWTYTGNADFGEYHLQQNLYRILLREIGIEIEKMYLQVITKETVGQLKGYVVHGTGGQLPVGKLQRACFLVEVPMLDDKEIWSMAIKKKEDLQYAIENDIMPPMCDETWGGRRCKDYCSVNIYCPYYGGK